MEYNSPLLEFGSLTLSNDNKTEVIVTSKFKLLKENSFHFKFSLSLSLSLPLSLSSLLPSFLSSSLSPSFPGRDHELKKPSKKNPGFLTLWNYEVINIGYFKVLNFRISCSAITIYRETETERGEKKRGREQEREKNI